MSSAERLRNLPKVAQLAGRASRGEKAVGPQSLHSSPRFPLGELSLCRVLKNPEWASSDITYTRPADSILEG